jgi:hypothetical protein
LSRQEIAVTALPQQHTVRCVDAAAAAAAVTAAGTYLSAPV